MAQCRLYLAQRTEVRVACEFPSAVERVVGLGENPTVFILIHRPSCLPAPDDVAHPPGGGEDLLALGTHEDEIGSVLLDVTIPGMSSREIFYKIQQTRPDLKVIVTSANSRKLSMPSSPGFEIDHFIRKPFLLGNLTRLLGDAL